MAEVKGASGDRLWQIKDVGLVEHQTGFLALTFMIHRTGEPDGILVLTLCIRRLIPRGPLQLPGLW